MIDERPIRFHPLASAELERARAWYAERSRNASELFLLELDVAVTRMRTLPDGWPRVREAFRRCPFRRFPFSLVYRTRSDCIEVIAVPHDRRRPGYWAARA